MEMRNFNKEFVERTKSIIQTKCNDDFSYDVTLLLNCLTGLVSLPTERTKSNELSFKTICTNKLNSMGVVIINTDDDKTFRTVKNAVSHMHINVDNKAGKIDTITLFDQTGRGTPIHTKLKFTVEQLKEFALFVADKHLERYKSKKQ